jgi:hypothetical protein
MADLFDSYISPVSDSIAYCDLTDFTCETSPTTRLLCGEISTLCGSDDCSTLIVNNGVGLCDCGDTWNANCCGNDTPFFIPFQSGDTYDFQFQQPLIVVGGVSDGWSSDGTLDSRDSAAYFEIRSCCDDVLVSIDESNFNNVVKNLYVGNYTVTNYDGTTTQKQIQMIRFDLGEIENIMKQLGLEPCFYFKFCFTKTFGKIQDPINPANVDCFCSEPFKKEQCLNVEKRSVLISSLYSRTDCFGMYYGNQFVNVLGGTPFVYSNEIRVPAVFEQTNFNITKNVITTSRKTTSTEVCENWILRSFPLPLRFMRLLVSVIAGADVYVDGKEFQVQGEISKNNETGTRWFTEINFEYCNCSKSLTC